MPLEAEFQFECVFKCRCQTNTEDSHVEKRKKKQLMRH